MANIKAAIKDIKKSRKKREQNLMLKENMKKAIRELKEAVAKGLEKPKLEELVSKTTQIIDKTAKARVIHKNNAARKKSKISRIVNKK